eukprot:c9762_g1_i2.p1 GENE.c9762_g1_i2~~c9762_g1_i2.p1  ORF type:complete len:373 (+),score=101.43 c9762_g1_i2:135-1121(+)
MSAHDDDNDITSLSAATTTTTTRSVSQRGAQLGVKILEGSTFTVNVDIPELLFRFIIGKNGSTKTHIETKFQCSVKIPAKTSKKNSPIVVHGESETNILGAKQQIESIAATNRNNLGPTHFISIPLYDATLHNAVANWQRNILTEFVAIEGLEASIMMAPQKVHLTLFVLRLLSPTEIDDALAFLATLNPRIHEILENRPLQLKLAGLEVMESDPVKTNVMYMEVEEVNGSRPSRLEQLGQFLVERFQQKGLCDAKKIKFHATVINTKYRSRSGRHETRLPFNATGILEKYRSHEFGVVTANEIHLSSMGSIDAKTKFYYSEGKLALM